MSTLSKKASINKEWQTANRDRYNAYFVNRRKNDLNFKLAHYLRKRLSKAVKGAKAIKRLGCTIEELKIHLESKFLPGMNWSNYGINGWHIDHIRPLASFDLTNSMELNIACHYTNLQPLWRMDNLKKGAKCGS